jgi:hypothetical protein
MPLRIDRVDTEIEILRKEADGAMGAGATATGGAGELAGEDLNTRRGRAALREKLRPIVMEILDDELARIKRKVGSP